MKSTIPLLVRSSPYPEKVKNFTLDDLYHDPVGQKIGKGCIQYIEVMTVLKEIRDHSRVNQHTPLISAGLSTPVQRVPGKSSSTLPG